MHPDDVESSRRNLNHDTMTEAVPRVEDDFVLNPPRRQ
jgi:hypothetical protein